MKEKRKISKSRVYWLSKKDIKEIGGLLYSDEEFRPVKGESAIWISNYARVLSKRKGKPRILKTVFQKGYHRLTLPQTIRGKRVKHTYYVHVLVAQAFCKIPNWINWGDRLEVHHINSVNRENDIKEINYASNLMYVPRKLHKAIDSIQEIAVKQNGKWTKLDFISAAEYYKISPYEFLESFSNEKYKIPDRIRGKYQYYSPIIKKDNGKNVRIDIRIVRLRDAAEEKLCGNSTKI